MFIIFTSVVAGENYKKGENDMCCWFYYGLGIYRRNRENVRNTEKECWKLYTSKEFPVLTVNICLLASLIKTIIGGAQIIDLMILVVDITKGIQTQTAECLVIGEITCSRMIVVLNKIDSIPADKRDKTIEKVTWYNIATTLSYSKYFYDNHDLKENDSIFWNF